MNTPRKAETARQSSDVIIASLTRIARREKRLSLAGILLKTLHFVTFCYIPIALLVGLYLPTSRLSLVLQIAVVWLPLVALAFTFIRRAFSRPDLLTIARQIERQFPEIQERISTTLELSEADSGPYAPSVSLRTHVAELAQKDAASLRPAQIVPFRPIRNWLALLLIPILAWSITLAQPALCQLSLTGLFRLAFPWQNRLPDSLADLQADPGDISIPEGEDLTISAKSHADRVLLIRDGQSDLSNTQELRRQTSGQWSITVRRVFKSFRYKLATSQTETRWFNVTVQPVLAIQSISIRYDYPHYTALAPQTVTGLDATIDALAGSRATLLILCSHPLDPNRSGIFIHPANAPKAQSEFHPFEKLEDRYQLSFPINFDATYTFALFTPTGAQSTDQAPRKIFARPDQIPSIVLLSPAPEISARPDDIIPIEFLATDDFAVAKLDQLTQIGSAEPQWAPIPFDSSNPKHVTGPPLNLLLFNLIDPGITQLTYIEYQLRVTDNRDPNPQTALSLPQKIRVDPAQVLSFQGALEQIFSHTLEEVIANTIRELDRAKPRLTQSKTRDGSEPLGEWQRRELQQAAKDLPGIQARVSRAAGQAANPTFLPISYQLAQIADGPLRTAAEQAARAELNIDNFVPRNDALNQSIAAIAIARAALQSILDSRSIDQRRTDSEAARDLESAKTLQQSVTPLLAQNQSEKAAQLQHLAATRLRQAIDLAPALGDPDAKRLAESLQKLIEAIHTLRQVPAPQPDQIAKLIQDLNQLKSNSPPDITQRSAKALSDLQDGAPQRIATALQNAEHHLRGLSSDSQSLPATAAQSAQEATQAQRESTLNPDAAAQSAAALSNAASVMNRTLGPSTDVASNANSPKPIDAQSSDSTTPHPSTTGPLPASIRDLGITPEQWLRLSPTAQKNVLGTSQQQGPLNYRPLIQDYYIAVSEMKQPTPEAQP